MKQSCFASNEMELNRISIRETSERIYQSGAHILSNLELMTALVRDPKAAYRLISLYENNLHSIALAGIDELVKIKGIGRAKAEIIKASFEFSQRAQTVKRKDLVIKGPEDVAKLVMPKMRHLEQEHFKVVSLNSRNMVLGVTTLFIGPLNINIVHPREVFKEALKRTAAAIILAHNHPSGNITPSEDDISVTKRLKEVGEILGIEVLDHIIIGDGDFTSIKDKGFL